MFERSTHSQRLERWLGTKQVENISKGMKGWYGKPIAVAGVPGRVYVDKHGGFRGRINDGFEMSALDRAEAVFRRIARAFETVAHQQQFQLNNGFTGIADLIAAGVKPGHRRKFPFYKVGPSGTTQATHSLWQSVNTLPGAGAAPAGTPGGRVPDSSTTGALAFTNPTTGTQHFVAAYLTATVDASTMLMYDRIFDVAKTMNSTATEAVTGVPTRYTSTTGGNVDSAENNFIGVECQTVLPATAHSWVTCQYTNQAGTTGVNLPSLAGISSCAAQRFDMPLNQWFAPLQTGDTGLTALTQLQCSAAVATGAINFVIGHPIAFFPCPNLTFLNIIDGVTSAFSFERIFDDACLTFLEPVRSTSTAVTYSGTIVTVSN